MEIGGPQMTQVKYTVESADRIALIKFILSSSVVKQHQLTYPPLR